IWTSPDQLGDSAAEYLRRQTGQRNLPASPAEHARAAEPVDKTLVMGFVSTHLGGEISNEMVAGHVAKHSDSMIGVAAVDPTSEDAADRAAQLLDRREFRGLTISPAAQNFHPADSRALDLYELAEEKGVPIFFSQGTHFPMRGSMGYARPLLLDEIAQEYPALTIVISALGHPWVEEGIALVGKHPRVFGDVAGLIRRPWQAYNALVLAHQFNVMDKVLFGSDFPYSTAADAIKSVYRLHEVTQGTNLPSVPRETLRTMVERDALTAMGIAKPGEEQTAASSDEEEEL
ncbi:MAG: amidohydrolase family protein, partial [Phycisphaerae bacterium]